MKVAAMIILSLIVFASAGLYAKDVPVVLGPLKVLREPVDLDYGNYPLLSVIFNHSSHKRIACVTCHHKKTAEGKLYVACTNKDCHSLKGPRERVPMSMFMAYHAPRTNRSCYNCHVREAAAHPQFKGCQPCHGPAEKVANKN